MPCKETECKCEGTKTELMAAGLGLFGHDKDGNCTNCGHPVLNHTDSSAAGPQEERVQPILDSNIGRELESYSAVGQALLSTPQISCIINKLIGITKKRILIQNFEPKPDTVAGVLPFAMFEGSSRKGKTQAFWSIQRGSDHPCLYLPCSQGGKQVLHRAFTIQSRIFIDAVNYDVKKFCLDNLSVPSPKFEVLNLRYEQRAFRTLGFLRCLIQALMEEKKKLPNRDWISTQAALNFTYSGEECTISDMRAWLQVPLIFGCDEVQTLPTATVQFMRNLGRACLVVMVLMGTSSSIVNMMSNYGVSRQDKEQSMPWAYLFTQFPLITRETLKIRCGNFNLDSDAAAFIDHVMQVHRVYGNRPGFVVKAVQLLNGKKFHLPTLMTEMRSDLENRTKEFLSNQRCLISAAAQPDIKEEELVSTTVSRKRQKYGRPNPSPAHKFNSSNKSLIIHHFADIKLEDTRGIWTLYNYKSKLYDHPAVKDVLNTFQPNIVFPLADDECILHLAFSFLPFDPYTARTAYEKTRSSGPIDSNPFQSSNDGMSLEACTAAAVMCASQKGRDENFRLSFQDFVVNFAIEMSKPLRPLEIADETTQTTLDLIGGNFPFLPPPNMDLCSFYQRFLPVGFLRRTRNADGRDGQVEIAGKQFILTWEDKDWQKEIAMGPVLRRIPSGSQLHFIICERVCVETAARRPNTWLRAVSTQSGQLKFSKMQEDEGICATLVLVFPLEEMLP